MRYIYWYLPRTRFSLFSIPMSAYIFGIQVHRDPGWVIMSAKDFPRVGLLIATQGVWKGECLVSKLGGNRGVAANIVDGWDIVEGKQGYFSFGNVATGFGDPRPKTMASWIVSAPKIKVTMEGQDDGLGRMAVRTQPRLTKNLNTTN
jgi:hypothetical protein